MNPNHWGYGDQMPRFLTNEDHNVNRLKQIANPRNVGYYTESQRRDAIAQLDKLATRGGLRKSKSKRYRKKYKSHKKSRKH